MREELSRKAEPGQELMELRHEPVPGYRKIFYIVLAVAVSYLGAVFLSGMH